MDKAEWHDNQGATSREEREIKRLLRSADSYNGFSLIGIFIPLLGWILNGIALRKTRAVLDDLEDNNMLHEKYIKRVRSIRSVSATMILVSIVSAVIWFVVLINKAQNAATQAAQQTQQQALQAAQAKQQRANQLNDCLNQAVDAYNTAFKANATGSKTDSSGNTLYSVPLLISSQLNAEKQQADDNCYKQYPQ